MENRKCLYADMCDGCSGCEHYCPAGDYTDNDIQDIVEAGRFEYLEAWYEYLSEG